MTARPSRQSHSRDPDRLPRRALVTGCSSGIGYAVAHDLLARGWDVVGVSRTRPLLYDEGFSWHGVDVSHPEEVARLQRLLDDAPLDALIHCATIRGAIGPLDDSDLAEWGQTIATNLMGAYYMVRAALPSLRRS